MKTRLIEFIDALLTVFEDYESLDCSLISDSEAASASPSRKLAAPNSSSSTISSHAKILYKRLIYYRHYVNNVLEEDTINRAMKDFFTDPVVIKQIEGEDVRLMHGTEMEEDSHSLWRLCSPRNKTIIWKWVRLFMTAFIQTKE